MSAPASAKDLEAPKVVPVDPATTGAREVKGVEFNDGVSYDSIIAVSMQPCEPAPLPRLTLYSRRSARQASRRLS